MFSGKSKLKRDHEKKSNYFTFQIKQSQQLSIFILNLVVLLNDNIYCFLRNSEVL